MNKIYKKPLAELGFQFVSGDYLQQGAAIQSFHEILPSLNEIFIQLVEGTPAARQFQTVTA